MLKEDLALLTLRLGAGGLMLFGHGLPKIMGFSQLAESFPDPLGLGSTASLGAAIFAEVFCALAVMLGAYTRYAAIPLVITMAVAAGIVHGEDPWAKKEMAVIYGLIFLTLVIGGGGRFSIDGRRQVRAPNPRSN